jgi:TRAP-type mannitol/chloroaromatic compound transport system permease large subunit
LYIFYIIIIGMMRPEHAPLPDNRQKISPRIFWEVFKTVLPPMGLIVLVLGSIFTGVATPTEASGVGALGATLLVWYNKKFSFKVFKEVNKTTFQTCGYIFGIFFGAQAFALVLRMLGGDEFIERMLLGLPFGPMGIIAFILGLVFFMGFFLDWIEISLIFLPLLAPILPGLGLEINGFGVIENSELVWFAVLVAVTLQTSFLTPPVGFTIFFLQGVAPEGVVLLDIYKGVVGFVILQLIGLVLVFLWPELVLWLPAMAYG